MPSIKAMLWDNTVPTSLASRMRASRSRHVRELIERTHAENGSCSIIDLGGTRGYWNMFTRDWLRAHGVRITLVNIDIGATAAADDIFTEVAADARSLTMFPDQSFDICHQNSLIEHVGCWRDKLQVAAETRRIARHYFVQTPNYWFPIEPHFIFPGFQFLPKSVRVALIRRTKLGWVEKAESYSGAVQTVEGCDLLTEREVRTLFPDAQILRERIPPFTKSLIAIRGTA